MLPYNDRAAVEKAFAEHGDRIACLITEAAPGNMGVVPPEPGFNAFLAETCRSHGALFVSDEVMTGFRASRLGQWGLDGAHEGWRPDLMTFGKVMGGGFPAAAFGGRADVMHQLAPEGPVYQAGTLSGNPVATTAGLATLRLATDDVYAHLDAHRRRRSRPPRPTRSPRPASPTSCRPTGTMFSVFFTEPARCATSTTPSAPTSRRTPRSSTPCSTAACTCRPRRTRRGSSPPPTTTAPSRPCSTPCPTRPAPPPQPRRRTDPMSQTPDTVVHLLRHGEVHNPEGVLYGRRDGYHLSDLGRTDGRAVAEALADRDITHLRSSPLERAQETAAPTATAHGLEIVTDERVIESTNIFEGKRFGVGDGALRRPSAWRHLWNPLKPSWGEPYKESWPG